MVGRRQTRRPPTNTIRRDNAGAGGTAIWSCIIRVRDGLGYHPCPKALNPLAR